MKPDISIVIPFHNEEESLKTLIPSLLDVVNGLGNSFEIYLVDDASTDEGVSVVEEYAKKNHVIKLIQLLERGGQTGCYREAFSQAQGDYIIRMDADLQDDPRDLPMFLDKINNGSELVMGLREARKHSRMLRLAGRLYDLLIFLLFDSPLYSNSGSYVAFKAEYMRDIPFRRNDHRYLPLIAMRRGARNISEVLVRHNERVGGESKYDPLRKLVFTVPEVVFFLTRYKLGVYDLVR